MRSLLPTTLALGLVFVFDWVVLGPLGSGLLSLLVALVGFAILVAGGLWAAARHRAADARSRLARAAVFVLLGAATFAVIRSHPAAELHRELRPGMSIHEVLRRLDDYVARTSRRWFWVSGWGTSEPRCERHHAAGEVGGTAAFTWRGDGTRTPADLSAAGASLATARQAWFTLRGHVGYVHLSVTLDGSGRVLAVCDLTGHMD